MSYYLPTIGRVKIVLNGYPEKLYKLLEKNKEIERLKKLLHIGILKDVFPGIAYSRWEYTLMGLYLANEFSLSRLEGLSSERKFCGYEISGRDVLQILILIGNIGHLPGTFGVEKAFLHELIRRNEHEIFLNKIGLHFNNKIDYTIFNKTLILLKLNNWFKTERKESNRKVLKLALNLTHEFYLSEPSTEYRRKLLKYLNCIRRLSYLLLDSLYINLPLRINYTKFTEDLSQQIDIIRSMLSYYVKIVYLSFYHSEEAREKVVLWQFNLKDIFKNVTNLTDKFNEFLKSSDLDYISTDSINISSYKKLISFVIPNKFGTNFLIENIRSKIIDKLEVDFQKHIKDAFLLLLCVPGLENPITEETSGGEIYCDLWIDNHKSELEGLIGCLKWFYDNFKTTPFGKGVVVRRVVEKLFALLAKEKCVVRFHLYPNDFYKEDKYFMLDDDKIIMFEFGSQSYEEVKTQFKTRISKEWDRFKRDKFEEMKSLITLLRKEGKVFPKKTIGILVPGEVIFSKEKKDIAEFDGCFITIQYFYKKIKNIEIYFIESKRGKRYGKSVAGKDLKNKIYKKLKIEKNKYFLLEKVGNIRGKSAYVKLVLKN